MEAGPLAERSERLRGRAEVEQGAAPRFDTEHRVLDDGQRRSERTVLLYDPDARGARGVARPVRNFVSLVRDLQRATIAAHDTRDDLDERALAGAVLTDQRVNGSRRDAQLRSAQHLAHAVALVDDRVDHLSGTWILPAT